MALYLVTRELGTLVAPELWVEEGIGKANLNNDENAIALCRSQRRFTRTLARH